MADLRSLSNEELIRLYGSDQMAAPKPADLSSMSDEQLLDAYEAHPSVAEDIARSAPGAAYHGLTGIAALPGLADQVMSSGVNFVARQVGAPETPRMFGKEGIGQVFGDKAFSVLPTPSELEQSIGIKPYEPKTIPGKISSAAITGGVGGLAMGGGGLARAGLSGMAAGGGGEAVGQGAEAIGLPKSVADAARLVTTIGIGGATNLMRPRDLAPTRAALSNEAATRFQAADQAGIRIAEPSIADFADRAIDYAAREGHRDMPQATAALSPTPMTEAVLGIVNDASLHDMTLTELHRLRQTMGNAISKADGNDRRIVMGIRDHLDDWMESLGQHDLAQGNLVTPQGALRDPRAAVNDLQEGIQLWTRVRKSDTVGDLMHRAELGANPKTGYSYEDALRQEFRTLAKSDRIRTFNPEERAAIERVVNGGPLDTAMRTLSAFAPRTLGGVARSSALGGALFGFGGGPVAAGLPVLAGEIGRGAERALVRKNAAVADMLMRGGAGTPIPAGPLLSGVPLSMFYGNMATRGPQ